ncbi:MAG: agmatine deiminase family protein [Lewinellaceae bacterium]|nr:agmatine deiminase family protein [Phaeodactylibacter sp.]MCB9040023.1 agmatine deiminase family protein [Lewinellaceae bacterium]
MKCFLPVLFFLCAILPGGTQPVVYSRVPMPPPPPVRTMAEWEEVQAVVLTWDFSYSNILAEIVRHSRMECKVVIITYNQEMVSNILLDRNIPLDNVEFIPAFFDSLWIRDYGPWTVYHNDVDSLMLVDWIYDDTTRVRDDTLPRPVAAHFGLPLYEATAPPYDWIHAGGNNLQDGMGSLFSSELVLRTNPGKTREEIEAIAQAYLGVTPGRYFIMPVLPYDSIHHLDMHIRFLDEETILIGQYPEGVADGPQIEENVAYLRTLSTAFGNPYRIIRIPMPPDVLGRYPDEGGFYRTYTNGIFVNNTFFVPIYEEQYDTTALRIYQEQLPGYKIVGIDCDAIVDDFGAIHCIAKLVGASNPLRIAHARLRDTENAENPYPVEAIIQHRSGIAEATLNYRTVPDGPYTPVPMALEDEAAGLWTAAIPAQPAHTEVQYYLHAIAHSGKEQVRPPVAPKGYFRFRVLGPSGVKGGLEKTGGLALRIFPNPVSREARLRFTSFEGQQVQIELANQQGQVVWSAAERLPEGEWDVALPVGGLAAGVYHLSVIHAGRRMGRVLVVGR